MRGTVYRPSWPTARLLVVDDEPDGAEPDVAEFVAVLLRGAGYLDVLTVTGGASALAAVEDAGPGVAPVRRQASSRVVSPGGSTAAATLFERRGRTWAVPKGRGK